MVADTALEILAADPTADPSTLAVKANDLEDLVRRFLSVREEMEPVFERLALTPRFDDRAIAACLGKPYDEFNSLADLEAMQRLSFIQSLSSDLLSMHGLMRKALRERMARYSPAKIWAGHSAWRRHYTERGEEALAFRHSLGVDAQEASRDWSASLSGALATGETKRHATLTAMGEEIEDELPYLSQVDAATLCLVWAGALRKYFFGEKIGQLSQAHGLIDRVLVPAFQKEEPRLWMDLHRERGRILSAWADLDGSTDRYERSLEASGIALTALGEASDAATWAQIQCERAGALSIWGRMTASVERMVEAVEACKQGIERISAASDPLLWIDLHISLCIAQGYVGQLNGTPDPLAGAISAGQVAVAAFSKSDDPIRWAEAQWALGNVYRDWADFDEGVERLELAIVALREAESIYTREVTPYKWADLQISISYSLVELGRRTRDTSHLAEVLQRCRGTLEIVTKESDSLTWSLAWGNIAKALRVWGDCDSDVSKYAESVAGYKKAIEARPRETMGFFWALAHVNLGDTLLHWNELEPSAERYDEAEACFTAAIEILTAETAPAYYGIATRGIEVVWEWREKLVKG